MLQFIREKARLKEIKNNLDEESKTSIFFNTTLFQMKQDFKQKISKKYNDDSYFKSIVTIFRKHLKKHFKTIDSNT